MGLPVELLGRPTQPSGLSDHMAKARGRTGSARCAAAVAQRGDPAGCLPYSWVVSGTGGGRRQYEPVNVTMSRNSALFVLIYPQASAVGRSSLSWGSPCRC